MCKTDKFSAKNKATMGHVFSFSTSTTKDIGFFPKTV
jgi:hypothetical protein